tara:strand:+ start:51 stop:269 length:219 start_codon:yes stop_codon:yes gene_type:complete
MEFIKMEQVESLQNINKDFLFIKKKLIESYNKYLNTIEHKCITNSCKRRHEEILGDLKTSLKELEDFKRNKL